MRKVLGKIFFNRPTLTVAQELLGKFLVRKIGTKTIAVMITETEAYDGPHDKASHASRGLTPRTKVMFGEAGRFYVYFTYGMHWMLNIVTGPKGYPAAVLIRSGVTYHSPLITSKLISKLIRGPARLTKYLHVGKSFNGKIAARKTGLWFENRGVCINKKDILAGKRIGVDYAGAWAKKLYNFRFICYTTVSSWHARVRNASKSCKLSFHS
ncbi:MAG: DNA-3-methyladenine glycosylase [Candidatus Liptonbacteria bacterium]|nr:DNA-3-methyladenine glycosylase [Candidatus Liptonbacteria bacterium]